LRLPASPLQERVWNFENQYQGTRGNHARIYPNIPVLLEIKGKINVRNLERSIQIVIQRHEALRTRITEEKNKLYQYIEKGWEFKLNQVREEFHKTPQYTNQDYWISLALKEARQPFNRHTDFLIRGTLIHMEENNHLLIMVLHRVIADRYSLRILLDEVLSLYTAFQQGVSYPLPKIPFHYADFSKWQRELSEELVEQMLLYWKMKLAGLEESLEIPMKQETSVAIEYSEHSLTFDIPICICKKIIEISKERNISAPWIFLAVYQILLSRYTDQEQVAVGLYTENRNQPGLEKVIGPISNILVINSRIDGSRPFDVQVEELDNDINEALEYSALPYERLKKEMNTRAHAREGSGALYYASFEYEKKRPLKWETLQHKIKWIETNLGMNDDELSLKIQEKQDTFKGILIYNSQKFQENQMIRLKDHYLNLLGDAVQTPGKEISRMSLLSSEEQHQLLREWNQEEIRKRYQNEKPLQEVFDEVSDRFRDRVSIIYHETEWTFQELKDQAEKVAGFLINLDHSEPGEPVCIMLNPSAQMIAGLLGTLKSGKTYVPIDPQYPMSRIQYILTDCNPGIIIYTRQLKERLKPGCGAHVLELEHIQEKKKDNNQLKLSLRSPKPEDTAYIIYTSGTTGKPKGCMVTHQNVNELIFFTRPIFKFDEGDVWVMAHSFCFDVSVWEMYGSLLNGGKLILANRGTIQDTYKFLALIKKHKITILCQTPTAFYSLQEQEMQEPGNSMGKHLRYIIFAGDKLDFSYLTEWTTRYSPGKIQLINMYGITETTVHSSIYNIKTDDISSPKTRSRVGRALPGETIYILDRNLNLLPIGVPGEIYVGGKGVSKGYLNRVELTRQKFIRDPFRFGKYMYRSGDLAQWQEDGNIEYIGRIDHQVKIRGFRVELGEIESHLKKHPAVKEAIVIATEEESKDKQLCAYLVLENKHQQFSDIQIKTFLSQKMPGYMIPTSFISIESIPLTPNGKIDRKALPKPGEYRNKNRTLIAPRDKLERRLAELWADVLNLQGEGEKILAIGIDTSFFHLGGHSLKAMTLAARIFREMGVRLLLEDMFNRPTIRNMSEFIREQAPIEYPLIEPGEQREYYPLSSAQKRLYILQEMGEKVTNYNLPFMMQLEGDVERSMLERAFQQLINRHESLRTSFYRANKEIIQKIHRTIDFWVEYSEQTDRTEHFHIEKIFRSYIQPFDLSRAPLIRVKLLKVENQKYVIMVDMHHIISDGTSMEIIKRDFITFYKGEGKRPLSLQYRDYAIWQNKRKSTLKQQKEYWINQYKNEIPVFELPIDYKRPLRKSFEGSMVSFTLNKTDLNWIKTIENDSNNENEVITLYMQIMAIFSIFLFKLTNQNELVIGAPTAGRTQAELEQLAGMFVNTLPLRISYHTQKNFIEYVSVIRRKILEAFENQEYQYEELVEEIVDHRDVSRNPLFDVVFILQNVNETSIKIPGLNVSPLSHTNHTAKFDLTLQALETEEQVELSFEYSTHLFKRETIERFVTYFKRIVAIVREEPSIKLMEVEVITEDERKKILFDFNETFRNYPKNKTIYELFRTYVKKRPGNIAVKGEECHLENKQETENGFLAQLTYGELDLQVQQLSLILRLEGVKTGHIVGILVEPGLEMIVAALGVLRAGAAYLPVDSNYPPARIQYLLDDSNTTVLVTYRNHVQRIQFKKKIVLLEGYREIPLPSMDFSDVRGNLAYVIYTSGTTGLPKGTLIQHHNVIRVVKNTNYIEILERDRILQLSNFAFDGSVFNIFGALLNGSALMMIKRETQLDMEKLGGLILRQNITLFFITTSLFQILVDMNPGSLRNMRKILVGGERMFVEHMERAIQYIGSHKIINVYGPTESTVYTTTYPVNHVKENDISIPIGEPIAQTRVYILGENQEVQPIGVIGELYIGGDGLAMGYINHPELTHEKFLPDPFYPGKMMYETGDLARWLEDGNIEFCGRKDHQVKIRGNRIELGGIESVLLKHREIREAKVTLREDEEKGKFLSAYLVTDPNSFENSKDSLSLQIRNYLKGFLPSFMIPTCFIKMQAFPLTPNGKVDLKALPGPDTHTGKESEIEKPRNNLEDEILKIWKQVLGIKEMGVNQDFFQLGGHSLKATLLIQYIKDQLKMKCTVSEVFQYPTIRELADVIQQKKRMEDTEIQIPITEKRDYYPVSSAQQRIFLIHQLDLISTVYNIPIVLDIKGEMEPNRVEKTIKKLIERHEALQTYFLIKEGKPVQRIKEELEFHLNYKETKEEEFKTTGSDFLIPFNLSTAPLLHIKLIKCGTNEYQLFIDMHHIILDGLSVGIFLLDFAEIYKHGDMPDLPLQYKDYSVWQRDNIDNDLMETQKYFWLQQFRGRLPVLNMPLDFPRPGTQNFSGDSVGITMSQELTENLKKLALNTGTTLFMVLLAAYNVLLFKYTGQEDIITGTPIAGRPGKVLNDILGMFANTLALRNFPEPHLRFLDFLERVKGNALQAFENQDYQLEQIIDSLNYRDASRNPLFDTMFVLQNLEISPFEMKGITCTPRGYPNRAARVDLLLQGYENNQLIYFSLEYSTSLYRKRTMEVFLERFFAILERLVERPEELISKVDMLGEEEKKELMNQNEKQEEGDYDFE
jgi:amino acid adenylation domain-containing protein